MTKNLQKMPRILLHLEGAAVLTAALIFYGQSGYSWWLFALLLLAPDLSALGYLHSQAIGSLCYNMIHTTVLPIALALLSLLLELNLGLPLALIWLAHIGMDRLAGYGLKYPDGFKVTHFNKL